MNGINLVLVLIAALAHNVVVSSADGLDRHWCKSMEGKPNSPLTKMTDYRRRIHALRSEMRSIEAYILTSYDENLNEEVAERDRRIKYLTGYGGAVGTVVVTHNAVAIWTEDRFLAMANYELECDWLIFNSRTDVNVTDWIASQLPPDARVGADPYTVPHHVWHKWDAQLQSLKFIRLLKLNRNLVDDIWHDRPEPNLDPIFAQPLLYAGESYASKLAAVRQVLRTHECDAMIVTSSTEIAYVLNLRGNDLPYVPVFKAYLIVTRKDMHLYVDMRRIQSGIRLHFQTEPCRGGGCYNLKPLASIWADLTSFTHVWNRVLVPSQCVFDHGVSEAVYDRIPVHQMVHKVSPIILLRAKKNFVEREGMRNAHTVDSAAMCETLSYIEQRYDAGTLQTELTVAQETDRSRRAQQRNKGLSMRTVVAFGPHGSRAHFEPFNGTDVVVTDQSTLIIESGGQYADGTTKVTRTMHLGEPTQDQKNAYTNVLRGIIQLSMLVFPESLRPSEVDALSRGPVWGTHADYPKSTGAGIGSFLSVHESPINVEYSENHRYTFKDGYFFSNEPGYYRDGDFGIRLANILEVVDTEKQHPSGAKFLALNDITLVPYEPKMIETALLSAQEKKWLNEYNAKIRESVGFELKRQLNMQAFYWMMNKTRYVTEYYTDADYKKHSSAARATGAGGGLWATLAAAAILPTMGLLRRVMSVA